MRKVSALHLTFALLFLISSARADGGWDAARQAAARLVAESLMTDQMYDAAIHNVLLSDEFKEYASNESVEEASKLDENKAFDAFVAAGRRVLPRDVLVDALSTGVKEKFSYEELKEILRFIRSDTGRRYVALAYDEDFFRSLEKVYAEKMKDRDSADALKAELSKRFPAIKFEF